MKNKKRTKKTRVRRLPRPTGLTILAKQLHTKSNNLSDEQVNRLFQYMLYNKMQINGQTLSLSTLANMLQVSVVQIYRRFMEYQEKMSKAFLGKAGYMSGAMFFEASQKILESHAFMRQQREVLSRSQGGQYRPFITDSVNIALKNELDAAKVILELYKTMKPTGPTNAFQFNNYGNPNEDNNGQPTTPLKSLSQADAIKLLEEQGILQIGYDTKRYQDIHAANGLDKVPEVRATHQDNVRTDAAPVLMPSATKKVGHENRRQVEEEIDPEDL